MLLRTLSIALSLLIIGPLALAETAPESAEPPVKAEEKPTVRPALGERSQAETAALERQLAAHEQQQLKTQANETFLALWRPANSATPMGAVILVPGKDESPDWPIGIGPLRHKLPDAGWSSLSLTLPDAEEAPLPDNSNEPVPNTNTETGEVPAEQPEIPAPPAEATSDPAEQAQDTTATPEPSNSDPAETQQAYVDRIFARIAAGITFAQQKGATTVVLTGQGTGAYWAARYIAEQQPQPVNNLLLVAAQAPAGFEPELETLISQLELATGDFYYKDQTAERDAAKQRLNAAKRQKRTAYLQVAMTSLPGNRDVEQEQLFRRIKGWLSLHLQGNTSPAAQ